MNNKTFQKTQPQKLRTARLSVSDAIRDALEGGKILKKLVGIYDIHIKTILAALKNFKIYDSDEITINLSSHELYQINEALRDYLTLRIANIFDSHPACVSLKDYPNINLNKIKEFNNMVRYYKDE